MSSDSLHNQSYTRPWRQWLSKTAVRWALGFISGLIIMALFADLISNDLPLSCVYQGERYFPAFSPNRIDSLQHPLTLEKMPFRLRNFPWNDADLSDVSWALLPYGYAGRQEHKRLSPFGPQKISSKKHGEIMLSGRFRHHFGTTQTGSDVLAGIIHGSRISLTVGILAITIAACIGIFLGAWAGFLGNKDLLLHRGIILALILGLFFAWFYGFYVRRFNIIDAREIGGITIIYNWGSSLFIAIVILTIAWWLGKQLSRLPYLDKTLAIPLDQMIMRLIEILNSLPLLLLIITIAAIFSKSVWSVMLIIGLFSWPTIARLVRAEMLRIRQLPYIEAGKALGIPLFRILFRHALPNALAPVWVGIALGIGQAIIVESALSFLNLIDVDTISWGSLMMGVKESVQMWWIGAFPGMMIFLTVLAFNVLGEKWRQVLNPT